MVFPVFVTITLYLFEVASLFRICPFKNFLILKIRLGGLLTARGASCLAGNRSKPGDPTMRPDSDLAEPWV